MDETLEKNPNYLDEWQVHIDADSKIKDKVKAKLEILRMYSARYQLGDIIEVREDGKPRGKREPESFLFLKVPGTVKQFKDLTVERKNAEGRPEKRREYTVDLTGIIFDKNKTASITYVDFNSRVRKK